MNRSNNNNIRTSVNVVPSNAYALWRRKEGRCRGGGEIGEKGGGKDSESESKHDDCEELGDLPPEIEELVGGGREYESDDALQEALVEAGVGDLRVVLVDIRPRRVVPSNQHNAFTTDRVLDFNYWAKRKWGVSSGMHKSHLSNGASRDPDVSLWGYPRCSKKPESKQLRPTNDGLGPIPDVVIQPSWQNKKSYEEDAINDMMNQGLEAENGVLSTTSPKLGYLIKVRFSKKRKLSNASVRGAQTQDLEGLDIYRLTHGTTISDACDPNNPNADHWRYVPGGPEAYIVITPQSLGIAGSWAAWCGDYVTKASKLFREMDQLHTRRQLRGLLRHRTTAADSSTSAAVPLLVVKRRLPNRQRLVCLQIRNAKHRKRCMECFWI